MRYFYRSSEMTCGRLAGSSAGSLHRSHTRFTWLHVGRDEQTGGNVCIGPLRHLALFDGVLLQTFRVKIAHFQLIADHYERLVEVPLTNL